jgi:hypothetical protein
MRTAHAVTRTLVRVGLIRINTDGTIRWPFRVRPWWIWRVHLSNHGWHPRYCKNVGGWFGVFRNRPGTAREPGRILPRRWGFRFLGIEIGDRG